MTKKKKTIKKKVKKDTSKIDFYEILLKYTVRNLRNDGSELDRIFMEQASRIKKEMKQFK